MAAGSPFIIPPTYEIVMPNGVHENAGALISQYNSNPSTFAQFAAADLAVRPGSSGGGTTAAGVAGFTQNVSQALGQVSGPFLANLETQLLDLLKAKVAQLQAQVAANAAGTGTGTAPANLGSSAGSQSPAPAPLTLEVDPTTRNIGSAGSVVYAVIVHSDFGLNNPVTLSVSGLPKGATGFFSPDQVSSNEGKSTLTVNITAAAAVDLYTLRVTGTLGDGSQKSTSFSIAIGATKNLDPTGGIVTPPAGTAVFGPGAPGLPLAVTPPGTVPPVPVNPGTSGGSQSFPLLANGSRDITVNVGDTIRYTWAATTPSATSSYTMDFGTDTCYTPPRIRQVSYPWIISTTNGQMTDTVQPCQAGVTYTVNFITIDASGNKLASQNIIRVNPASHTQTSLVPVTSTFSFTLPSTAAGSQSRTVVFNVPSGQSIPYLATTSASWLSTPASGTATLGTSAFAFITLSSSAASLSPGTYTGTVTFSPDPISSFTFPAQSVSVTLMVNP
jgi:hypothetical protein